MRASLGVYRGPLSIIRSTNSDRYTTDLASVYRSWRIYDPSYALSRDPDIDEKARKVEGVKDGLKCEEIVNNSFLDTQFDFSKAIIPQKKPSPEFEAMLAEIPQRIFIDTTVSPDETIIELQAVDRAGEGKPELLVELVQRRDVLARPKAVLGCLDRIWR